MSEAGANPPFDRALHVVLRERVRSQRVVLNRSAGIGVMMAVASIVAWSWLGPVLPTITLGIALILLRVGLSRPPVGVRETVTRPARVRITDEGVDIEDEAFVRREDIAQAYYQPRRVGFGAVRALDARGNVLFELETKDEVERNELLRALGRDVAHGRALFPLASPLFASTARRGVVMGIFVAFAALAFVLSSSILLYPLLTLFALFVIGVSARQQVEVGVDGLLVRWLGDRRFVRYEELAAVAASGMDVKLTLAGGRAVFLAAGTSRAAHEVELARDALFARIEEARRAYAERTEAGELVARVGRGARAIAEWRADLERMHHVEASGYRDPVARGEDLWRVVEDVGAPEEARAGAAVALRREEGAGPRLRIAAEASASPHLRVALEKASDPEADEAALDEALAALSLRAR